MFILLLLSVSLALDALSVSVTEGALVKDQRLHLAMKLGLTFGAFQAVMAFLGLLLNGLFMEWISPYASFVAAGIFFLLGVKMITEALAHEEQKSRVLSWGVLLLLGLATSIDAAAAGVTLPLMEIPTPLSVILIGVVTLVLCFLGALLGVSIKEKFSKLPLELFGGVLLMILAGSALMKGL